jgi:hypothetical protein
MRGWRGCRGFLAGVWGLVEGADGGGVRRGAETLPSYLSTYGEVPGLWE